MITEQINVSNFTNLLTFIVEIVSRSISDTQSSLLKKNAVNNTDLINAHDTLNTNRYRTIIFDDKEPIWPDINPKKVQVVKYECNKQLCCEPLVQRWYIEIGKNPFAEGGMRLAYYGLMQYKDTWEKIFLKNTYELTAVRIQKISI
jgi:hypothetical protein